MLLWLHKPNPNRYKTHQMKRIQGSLLAVLISISAAQADLPDGAKALLGQLDEFETQALKPAQEQIAGARKQAAALLEAEMVSATRAGDLEGALAIKTEMERLQKPVAVEVVEGQVAASEPVSDATPEPSIADAKPVSDALASVVGKTYKKTVSAGGVFCNTIEFHEDKSIWHFAKGKPQEWGYVDGGSGDFHIVTDGGNHFEVVVSRGGKRLEIQGLENGKPMTNKPAIFELED